MAKGARWTAEEFRIVRENAGLSAREVATLLPGRTTAAVAQVRARMRARDELPAVKPPGDYIEMLSEYFAGHFEEMAIWLKWNGYASYKVLSRDRMGYLTLLCVSKLSGYPLSNNRISGLVREAVKLG
jgi:hypothetical protein